MPLPATTRNSKLSRSRPAGREDSKDDADFQNYLLVEWIRKKKDNTRHLEVVGRDAIREGTKRALKDSKLLGLEVYIRYKIGLYAPARIIATGTKQSMIDRREAELQAFQENISNEERERNETVDDSQKGDKRLRSMDDLSKTFDSKMAQLSSRFTTSKGFEVETANPSENESSSAAEDSRQKSKKEMADIRKKQQIANLKEEQSNLIKSKEKSPAKKTLSDSLSPKCNLFETKSPAKKRDEPEESNSEIENFLTEVNNDNLFLLKPRRSPRTSPRLSPTKKRIPESDSEEYMQPSQKRQLYDMERAAKDKYVPPSVRAYKAFYEKLAKQRGMDPPSADLFATDDEGSQLSSEEEFRRWKKKRSTLPKTASKSIKPLGIKDGENNQSKNEESKKAGTEKRKPSGDLCPLTFDAEDTELLYHSEYNKQQLGLSKSKERLPHPNVMKRQAESGKSFAKPNPKSSDSEREILNSQDVEEACRKAISSVLNEKSRINENPGPLTPDKVSAACKRALEAVAKNPAPTTSKGVRRDSEGEPFTPRRIQEAVKAALQSVAKNPLPRSEKGAKRHSGETLVTPEKKKPRSPNLQKVRPGCREDLKALKGLDGNGASDNDELTPDEYGPDGKTKPDALEAKRVREEARKNFSPNTSDDRDFEKQEKDFNYYKEGYKRCKHELAVMQDKWKTHKMWCIQARKDLYVGKVELLPYSGVFITKDKLKEVLETQETPNKVARALLKAVCNHDELMTKSLLGRSGPKNNETRLKDPFPALDKRKKQAIIDYALKYAGFDVKYLRKHRGDPKHAEMMGNQRSIVRSLTDFLRDYKINHAAPLSDSEEESLAQSAVGTAKSALARVHSSDEDSD